MLDHRAGLEVAHLHLDEAAQVARCAVFHLEDREQVVVELHHHARAELCCGDLHKGSFSLAKTPTFPAKFSS